MLINQEDFDSRLLMTADDRDSFVEIVALRNVARSIQSMRELSRTLSMLETSGRVVFVGAMYNIGNSEIEFLADQKYNSRK